VRVTGWWSGQQAGHRFVSYSGLGQGRPDGRSDPTGRPSDGSPERGTGGRSGQQAGRRLIGYSGFGQRGPEGRSVPKGRPSDGLPEGVTANWARRTFAGLPERVTGRRPGQ